MIKKKYLSIAKVTMQNTMAYRFNYIISLLSSFIFILSMFYLWKSIYADKTELAGFTWEQMKTYLFITFLSNTLVSWYSETRISRKILDGSVAMDLLKPIDFQKARLSETIGSSLVEGFIAAIMISIFVVLFAGIILPKDLWTALLFIFSLVISLGIKFGIVYLFSLLCFWTTSSIGIAWSRAAITNLFSGALIPLTFFPEWLKSIAYALPFQGIVSIPASIYLGKLEFINAFQLIGLQVFWMIGLWLLGKLMWNFAVRQITIHGG
ncbi:ABC transporter permease [Metabacillus halosaccharovorans]|uniref:ABC-2 family transporter protein n=1 Tax=Metabacillus halosaccharovorans TaxID=930124 RepID=UPI00403D6C8A